MSRYAIPAVALALSVFAVPALAQNGGDRMPAGGAFMSTYGSPSATTRAPEAPNRGGSYLSGRGYDVTTGAIPARRAGEGRR